MNMHTAARAYARVDIESGASAADPHKLIAMLYQGALLAVANARNSILRSDTEAKIAAITKALQIVDDGLNASLDKSAGGELAHNLNALYDYMCARLLDANLHNDVAALDEVSGLLNELKGAWDSIRPAVIGSPVAAPAPTGNQPAALVYGRN